MYFLYNYQLIFFLLSLAIDISITYQYVVQRGCTLTTSSVCGITIDKIKPVLASVTS